MYSVARINADGKVEKGGSHHHHPGRARGCSPISAGKPSFIDFSDVQNPASAGFFPCAISVDPTRKVDINTIRRFAGVMVMLQWHREADAGAALPHGPHASRIRDFHTI